MSLVRKRVRDRPHLYLSGNFAPLERTLPLTPCTFSGIIPSELHGGEYVRNGGNPVANKDLGRDAHFFDGDGMLCGVSFAKWENGVRPHFVNQFILTDVYLSTQSSPFLRIPMLPSISTLCNPLATLLRVIIAIFRTLFLVLLSHLPGSMQAVKRISVANTSILFHDGRALATCESGPPIRVSLPGLETVGWYNGKNAEGERKSDGNTGPGFGGNGILGFMKEWTTGHPRVDRRTGELILFHSTLFPPFVSYSVIPSTHPAFQPSFPLQNPTGLVHAPVPGVSSSKMMHDFGVSSEHTVIMDLPLSLNPLNLLKNKPVLKYDVNSPSRFGVFPRHNPERVRWFETNPCCIFHTANTWDDKWIDKASGQTVTSAVNLLVCRQTSASVVYAAGDIPVPSSVNTRFEPEEEQSRLYYFQFSMDEATGHNNITHQFGLSAIMLEYPSTCMEKAMEDAKFVYGCSTTEGKFEIALGRGVKINVLAKINAEALIKRGKKDPRIRAITGCVDTRNVSQILESSDPDDPIQLFAMPDGWFAQEPRFVARSNQKSEDDGWLLTYVYDESQLNERGECPPNSSSELWIIDAKDMKTVVGRVQLPQRVPYGLHGNFLDEHEISNQRPLETIRGIHEYEESRSGVWHTIRSRLENWVG